jgi:hypothetical protein
MIFVYLDVVRNAIVNNQDRDTKLPVPTLKKDEPVHKKWS